MRSVLGVHWRDWYWSWNFNILATWCRELTHLQRPWCWERLRAGGQRDDRGTDSWMASLTQWTWVWVNSGSWWWTGRPGILRFIGSQRVRDDWVTGLNWIEPGSGLGSRYWDVWKSHNSIGSVFLYDWMHSYWAWIAVWGLLYRKKVWIVVLGWQKAGHF